MIFSITQAKAKLSDLIDRALAGEEIIISRRGKPVARLVPIVGPHKPTDAELAPPADN